MPDYNLIELAVKALAGEAHSFRGRGTSASDAERTKLAENLNGLVATVMSALTEEKDPAGREKAAELLKTLVALQSGLVAAPGNGQGDAAAAARTGLEAEGYELYKLPSGVEVYSRRLPNGTSSDSYYCPVCLPKGKTATLEFKFGGGGKYACPRCSAVYPISTPPAPVPPTPPPQQQSAQTDAASADSAVSAPEAVPLSSPVAPSLSAPAPHPTKERILPPVFGNASGVRTWRVSRSPGVELEAPKEYSPTRARLMRWWTNFGQGGFLTSVFAHLILIVVLMTWVIASSGGPKAEEVSIFDTPQGGPKGDASVRFKDRNQKKEIRKIAKTNPMKIAVSKPSPLNLPEFPLMQNSLLGGAVSGGFRGPGGTGNGLGTGNGRFFASMPVVMGLPIRARNMAVYLDNSGSMVPYLKPVKDEIFKGFPNADVYEHDGIRITVRDGKVDYGRPSGSNIFSAEQASNNIAYLHEKYRTNFDAGSIGAWMDIMLFQGYDALVIFSDFEDGVEQSESVRGRIFVDTPYERDDKRKPTERKWEEDWIARCKQKPGGPRIYLFSIKEVPQKIWKDCVQASGGAIKMKPDLRVDSR